MKKRRINVKHSQIFDYWKDKAITRDGKIVPYDDMSVEAISIVFDWGEPRCWACGRSIEKVFDYATYEKYLLSDFRKIWDYAEVLKNLNKCHIREIRKIDPESEFIFVNSQGDRMTTNCFRNRIKKICKLLEIPPKSPHKVRKTYGSILLDNHVDNKLIMGQMGHTDILCTENYYHRNRRSLESKEKILSAIPEFNITGDLITK